jgi:hypothetical protein
MAATNPFKVTDLVSKYGWQFLGYLANLGVDLPTNAAVLFVDSNATNASDADDTEHGHSFDKPLATLDYAIGLCTDGQGDVILIAPGHTENLTAATSCVVDKSDLTIVGLGHGLNRPTFSLATSTAAKISVTVANVTIKNIRVVSALANVAEGLDAEAGANGLWLEDCYFSDGNAANLELLICVTLAAECDDVTIKNCQFHTVTGGGCTSAIDSVAGNDRLRIEGCDFYGYWGTACVDQDETTASLEIMIKNNNFVNMGGGNVAVALKADSTGTLVGNNFGALGGTLGAAVTNENLMICFDNLEADEDAKAAVAFPETACS